MRQQKSQSAQIKPWASNGVMIGRCGVLCTVLRLVYIAWWPVSYILVRTPQLTTTTIKNSTITPYLHPQTPLTATRISQPLPTSTTSCAGGNPCDGYSPEQSAQLIRLRHHHHQLPLSNIGEFATSTTTKNARSAEGETDSRGRDAGIKSQAIIGACTIL